MFSHIFKTKFLNIFHTIELSYEQFSHNKVSNFDLLLAIPKGPKCFLWITKFKNKFVSIFFILDKNKNISDISFYFFNDDSFNYLTSFNGTIFYGTLFFTSFHKCFSIENIFYHCGKNIQTHNWATKFSFIESLLSKNLQSICDPKIIIGLPILSQNIIQFQELLTNSVYTINKIDYRNFYDSNKSVYNKPSIFQNYSSSISSNSFKSSNSYSVFLIKPTLQDDIYELFDINNNNSFVDIAHIPDFKTSVMMNNLFRNIKENKNLDALEESDDESEFQNNSLDQFVFLDVSHKMKCYFNKKFQKWQPIELSN